MKVGSEKSENMTIAGVASVPCPPPAGLTLTERQRLLGAVDIRILKDGTWMHQGAPIRRPALVNLFASVLRRDRDGRYWLITPAEVARIEVEDAPLLAVELRAARNGGESLLRFRTNVETWITAGPDRPIRVETAETGEPRPYLRVADDGTEARLLPAVFYQLVDMAQQTDVNGVAAFAVESRGARFVLGPAEDA